MPGQPVVDFIGASPQTLERAVTEILAEFDDENREGLRDTPRRVVAMYRQLLTSEPFELTTFSADGYSQMIVERDIPFYSLCEHHLIPFFGVAHVGYIPDKRIVGISKLARTVEMFARRLQVQERMTMQVAKFLQEGLKPKGIGVLIEARHLCQEMRGVKKHNVSTVTSSLEGVFREGRVREEFLDLCGKR